MKNSIHLGSVVKWTLLGEIAVAENTKLYVEVVGGHEIQVGVVGGLLWTF